MCLYLTVFSDPSAWDALEKFGCGKVSYVTCNNT